METAQEREVRLQGRQAWPFHMMATTSCFDNYSSSSGGGGGDCFVLGWEQPLFGCSFGVLAAADVHELFPLFAGMESPLPVSSALAVPPPPAQDAVAMPEELDDLLLDFWDASCHDGDVDERQVQVAFNSSCFMQHEKSCTATATATTNSSFHYDDDPLSSIFSAGPAVPDQALLQAPAEPLSSSSSNCHADPHVGDSSGTPAATPSAARAPPMPRSSSSLKRSTREEESDQAECSQSDGKRRKTESPSPSPATGVVCPFALLKPDGLDGGATLADINARILMRPARPVRHPVGEFACAPRVSADQPGISGKAVSSFTRLHTPGRGTITIIRTRG
ncbi:uncharacterized protein LOC133901959 isoform X2 [Phragmites australis]|uniref:uncharacterized protein LOC133901959 isoform X2 n=1 Tax=Phragmites australis TaxID=29695 RepID=UPI002D79D948|nr:uncharacterized protein LOC133901959 isoform X2 [Phragmites australis]